MFVEESWLEHDDARGVDHEVPHDYEEVEGESLPFKSGDVVAEWSRAAPKHADAAWQVDLVAPRYRTDQHGNAKWE